MFQIAWIKKIDWICLIVFILHKIEHLTPLDKISFGSLYPILNFIWVLVHMEIWRRRLLVPSEYFAIVPAPSWVWVIWWHIVASIFPLLPSMLGSLPYCSCFSENLIKKKHSEYIYSYQIQLNFVIKSYFSSSCCIVFRNLSWSHRLLVPF